MQQDTQFAAPVLSMAPDYGGGSQAGGVSVIAAVSARPADLPTGRSSIPTNRTGQEAIPVDLGEQPPRGYDAGQVPIDPADSAVVDPSETGELATAQVDDLLGVTDEVDRNDTDERTTADAARVGTRVAGTLCQAARDHGTRRATRSIGRRGLCGRSPY